MSIEQSGLLTRPRWNPYLVGISIGVLSWLAFAVVNSPLGVTTSLSAWSGGVCEIFVGEEKVKANSYWAKTMPAWDYGSLFLVGTFLGALAGSLLSRDFKVEIVPTVWRQRFGNTPAKRLLAAFLGGVLAMYGARMAGGCTSGNGLSGSMQLAVSGWVFFITMFIAGLATAFVLFGRRTLSTEERSA